MRIGAGRLAAAVLVTGLTGCAVHRYPVMPPASAAELGALTCGGLDQAQAEVDDTGRRIAEIAATGRAADGARPVLYSTARADADRAVRARATAIAEARQARGCAA